VDLAPYRAKYGRFPLQHRDWPVDPATFERFSARGREPMGAATLVWNREGAILLLRADSKEGRSDLWETPGGFAERGESPEACAVREAKEETGLAVTITTLDTVILCHVTNEDRVLPYNFFQFEGEAQGNPRPGEGIAEAAWLDRLPVEMHFRADYVEPWMRRRPAL
jgi:8-oxo-dGTP pyrophosphatase MutT (NUDIX family)